MRARTVPDVAVGLVVGGRGDRRSGEALTLAAAAQRRLRRPRASTGCRWRSRWQPGRLPTPWPGCGRSVIAACRSPCPTSARRRGLVDDCTAVARAAGRGQLRHPTRPGAWWGTPPTVPGFVAALRRGGGFDPDGRRCLVVGAGGAARAVVLALAEAGAHEVVVVNRTAARAVEAAALAGGCGRVGSAADVGRAELVVQATPLGMAGCRRRRGHALRSGPPPPGPGGGRPRLPPRCHPPSGRGRGGRGVDTVGGLGMLVHQAALAIERWTGQPAPVEAMWAAVRRHG